MRNWNPCKAGRTFECPPGFEPTYEELKPIEDSRGVLGATSFEPTYEELKRLTEGGGAWGRKSFEPTYEELKQIEARGYILFREFWAYLWGIETGTGDKNLQRSTSFWAYLWGIETCSLPKLHRANCSVLSLPMRNWNSDAAALLFETF